MRPGFWQIVLLVGLAVLFFHRPIIAVFRALAGGLGVGGKSNNARVEKSVRCYSCGALLPRDSRFCPKCGRSQDVIDV